MQQGPRWQFIIAYALLDVKLNAFTGTKKWMSEQQNAIALTKCYRQLVVAGRSRGHTKSKKDPDILLTLLTNFSIAFALPSGYLT
jgi:hypothetical protein